MFGFGKSKEYDVHLTEKQMRDPTKTMRKSERKAFEKKQRQIESDREWDHLMMMEVLMDD